MKTLDHGNDSREAGCGKSHLTKCLITTLREMCGSDDVIHVACPTGRAAFAAFGETLHRLVAVNTHSPKQKPSVFTRSAMIKRFRNTLVLVMDERSMINTDVLGAAELNISDAAHCGQQDWGGFQSWS